MLVLKGRHCGRLPHILERRTRCWEEEVTNVADGKAAAARDSPQRWELRSRHQSSSLLNNPNASIQFRPSYYGRRVHTRLGHCTSRYPRIPILGVVLISIKLPLA